MIAMHVGKTLQRLQRYNDVNCTQLAKDLKTSPQQVSRWRQMEDMKISQIKQLADYFKVSVEEFVK